MVKSSGLTYSPEFFYGIKYLPCRARDATTPVLSQHSLIGSQSSMGDAIGLGQGETHEAGPNLRRQVQNSAAHGMVGFSDLDTGMKKQRFSLLRSAAFYSRSNLRLFEIYSQIPKLVCFLSKGIGTTETGAWLLPLQRRLPDTGKVAPGDRPLFLFRRSVQ